MTTGKTIALTILTFVGKDYVFILHSCANQSYHKSLFSEAGAPKDIIFSFCFHHFFQSWVYLQILKHLTSFWFLISELQLLFLPKGFPDGSVGKESACNSGDTSLIPVSGRSSGEGIGYPLQYSWASLAAQLVNNLPVMWDTWVVKIPWRRERLPTPVFWPGEYHGL